MDEVMGKDRGKIAHLFEGCQAALVWSCLQNCMGRAWADRLDYPEAAQIIVGDFCLFAGKANEALVKNIPVDFMSDEVLMVPQNESWEFLIRKIYGTAARGFARYAIKKEGDIFDRARLKRFVDKVSDPYCLKEIDRELYHKVLQHEWSKDFCALYKNYEDYRMHGLGYVALYRGEPVSGASAYGYYRSGIEIEVDTKTGYRRQGLAAACAARLILECLSRNIYPSWDAHSLQSAGLAQKLGYHADRPYDTYAVKIKKSSASNRTPIE